MLNQFKIHNPVSLTALNKSSFSSLFKFSLICSMNIRHQGLCWMSQWIIKYSRCTQEVFNLVIFCSTILRWELLRWPPPGYSCSAKPLPTFLLQFKGTLVGWWRGSQEQWLLWARESVDHWPCPWVGLDLCSQYCMFTHKPCRELTEILAIQVKKNLNNFPGMSSAFCINHNSSPFPRLTAAGHRVTG